MHEKPKTNEKIRLVSIKNDQTFIEVRANELTELRKYRNGTNAFVVSRAPALNVSRYLYNSTTVQNRTRSEF